ncbi:MAG: hypothetical protein GW876_05905 [Bacteroidetes bacterium]|nr:hypothetical protein [Bacteroidota bacterium]PIX32954.1 MAG: hypothetical protein COZ59_11255 [Bacteroidetes bacterium CG_4_8_14_3_um_filter_31_14]
MNIELTKNQYQTLLILMYCGEWMLNSYKTKEDEIYKKTDKFEKYIFSFAKEYGFDKWIEYDEESGKYFSTDLMDNDLRNYIAKYNKRQKEI